MGPDYKARKFGRLDNVTTQFFTGIPNRHATHTEFFFPTNSYCIFFFLLFYDVANL